MGPDHHNRRNPTVPSRQRLVPWSQTDLVIAVLMLLIFLSLAVYRLESPAMIWDNLVDEYRGAQWAVHFGRTGRLPADFFGGYPLYHGRLTSYLMFPLFYLCDPSYTLIKLWPVAFGLLTLIATFLFVRMIFNSKAAFLALLLLVIHPSFAGGIRIGNMHVSSMLFFSTGSLYLLSRWWKWGKVRDLGIGMFLAGLGMGTRLWFFWYIAGLAVTALFFHRDLARKLAEEKAGGRWRTLAVGFLAFGIGLLPILWMETRQGFPFLQQVFSAYYFLGDPAERYSMVDNLVRLWNGFSTVLSGRWVPAEQFHSALEFKANRFYPWALAAGLIWTGYNFLSDRKGFFKKKSRNFLWTLFLAMAAQGLLNPGSKDPSMHLWYFFILYPFPQMLIAVTFLDWSAGLRNSRWRLVPVIGLGILILGEVRSLGSYMQGVRALGGLKAYSQATRDLAGWLKANSKEVDAVVVANGHLMMNLYFWDPRMPCVSLETLGPDLTQLRASKQPILTWRQELRDLGFRKSPFIPHRNGVAPLADPERNFFPGWEGLLASRHYAGIYVVRYNFHHSLESVLDLLLYWTLQRDRFLQLKARFFDADGTPMYEVYLLKPDRRAEGPAKRFDPEKMAF